MPINPPVSAWAARAAIVSILAGLAVHAIPPHYALYATSVFGCCAWVAASWRPTSTLGRWLFIVVNALGANVGFAKNAPHSELPPT